MTGQPMGPDEFAAEETQRAANKKAAIAVTIKDAIEQTDQAIKACVAEGKRLEALTAVQQNRFRALKERQAALDVVRTTEGLL